MRLHRMGGMVGGRMIVMADTNKDGRVLARKRPTPQSAISTMADANRDGQITPEERRQMHAR